MGGSTTYGLLLLDNTARVAALGSGGISVKDNDLGLAFQNPSLLDSCADRHLAMNYVNYFAGINYGYASYAHHLNKWGTWSATLQLLNYGKFRRFDEFEQDLGEFTAGEYMLAISNSHAIDSNLQVGATLKLINSVLDQWQSFGMALDLAATYHLPQQLLTMALVIRNAGVQLKPYVLGNREPLPFEIRAGITKKLKHAPFRLSLGLDNLQRWDLTYSDPNAPLEIDPTTGDVIVPKEPGFIQKLALHANFGVELLLGKSFYVASGFNYRRRREMVTETRPALTGFSIGAGIRIKRFSISYAHSGYHRAGGTNLLTLTTDLSSLRSNR